VNEGNSDALFACSNLNVLYVLKISVQRYDTQDAEEDPAGRKSRALGADWIQMIRGVEAVLHSVHERVRLGPLKAMLDIGNWDDVNPNSSFSAQDVRMREVCEIWAGVDGYRIYDEALYVLRKCCAYVQQFSIPGHENPGPEENRRVWSEYLFWFHYALEDCFLRLQQRQPVALVVFAYFGALFYGAKDFWFVGDCGRNIVNVVDELLGDYWRYSLRWPKQTVGLE
jgi:hypothetical protein